VLELLEGQLISRRHARAGRELGSPSFTSSLGLVM
jgi:hypothetical protein